MVILADRNTMNLDTFRVSPLQQEWRCNQRHSTGNWVYVVIQPLFCSLATLTERGKLAITRVFSLSQMGECRKDIANCRSNSCPLSCCDLFQWPPKSMFHFRILGVRDDLLPERHFCLIIDLNNSSPIKIVADAVHETPKK